MLKLQILNNILINNSENKKYNKYLFYFLLKLQNIIDCDLRPDNKELKDKINNIILEILCQNEDLKEFYKIYQKFKEIDKEDEIKDKSILLKEIENLKKNILTNFFSTKGEIRKTFPQYFEFYGFLNQECNMEQNTECNMGKNNKYEVESLKDKYFNIIVYLKENSELFKELRKNFLNEDFNFNSIFLEKLNDEDNFLLLFFLFDSVSREELFKINAPEYKKNFKLLYQSFFNIKNVDNYDLLLIAFEYFQMLDNELLENELLEKKEFFNKVMLFISELLLRDRSDYKLLILYNLLKKNNTKLLTNIRLHNLDKKVSSDMFNYYLKGNYSLIKNIDYNELALIAQSIVKSNIVNEYIKI